MSVGAEKIHQRSASMLVTIECKVKPELEAQEQFKIGRCASYGYSGVAKGRAKQRVAITVMER